MEKAIPLVEQAEAALNTLNKKDFQEAKALNKPPPGVEDITAAVMHLLATGDPIIEVWPMKTQLPHASLAIRKELPSFISKHLSENGTVSASFVATAMLPFTIFKNLSC